MSQLLIQFSHLYHSFGDKPLLENISLSIHRGEIFALIGENGAGKTTFLRLLSGALVPDAGHLSRMDGLSVGFLPQEIVVPDESMRGRAYLEEGALSELEKEMSVLLGHGDLSAWAELHDRYEHLGGYRRVPIEKVLRTCPKNQALGQVLRGLKLEESILDLPMRQLSGGQKIRVGLAKALIQNQDLLFLDEPTNHLDAEMLAWLENTLRMREGATVIVSHDRKFLNATCNRLIEIKNGKLSCYGGNYDFYLEEKRRQEERAIKAYEEQEEERALLKQKIKAMTFAKTKATPSKDRNLMAYDRRGEKHQKSVQNALDGLKARLKEIEENRLSQPKPKNVLGLRFVSVPLTSSVAIELENITKKFGNKLVFSNLTKSVQKGDRIVLTGPNGSGKTTLLKCMAGLLAVDEGRVRYAETAKIGYLDQEVESLPMKQTPLEYFGERFQLSEEDLRRELHKSAIGGDELLRRPFSTLSVGQRKRFMILSLILERPNVLLLDEPTNHLDFITLEALEKALLQFDGAIVAVSHDATFIKKVGLRVCR